MRNFKITVIWMLALMIVVVVITFLTNDYDNYSSDGEISIAERQAAFSKLSGSLTNRRYTYVDYLNDHKSDINYTLDDIVAMLQNPEALYDDDIDSLSLDIGNNDIAIYHVSIPEDGFYYVELEYLIGFKTLNNLTISIEINGRYPYDEARTIDLPLNWRDESKTFRVDRFGDEVLSKQLVYEGWRSVKLYNNTYVSVLPLLFELEAGLNVIEILNTTATTVRVGDLKLVAPISIPTYETYRSGKPDKIASEPVVIDATEYVEKNSSFVRLTALNDPSVTPFDAVYRKLNIIDGLSWDIPGQSITYEIEVPTSGNYHIALHYQNPKHDFSVFRSIEINGSIPFDSLKAYEFTTTGTQSWRYEVLSDSEGLPYLFYLTPGTHTITLRAESEPVEQALRYLQLVIDHINDFTLDIRKIAGREVDRERSWRFTENIPETVDYLDAYEVMLKSAIQLLTPYAPNGSASTTLSFIQKALNRLSVIAERPDRIPLYLEDLAGGPASINQYLGNSLAIVKEQPLHLNQIILNDGNELPGANASVFVRAFASLRAFFSSFTSDKFKFTEEADVVDVWVNRPITFVDLMQRMVDQTFTQDTGIQVKLSVMPDPNVLVMASAANRQPDVALGLASHMPYDLAIRGAAYNLATFPDYWTFAGQFAPGVFIPYILNDGVYALPETLDFNVIIYRKDIFEALNFIVPDTWDEVIQILPELQQYGMNFFHPIAGGVSTKWFFQTSGFIYQFDGSLYAETGVKSNINSPEAVRGLTFLNQLFTHYSLPEQVGSFYNSFRNATLPIGIADFGTYLLIKNAAPELAGLWEIAAYPSITIDGVENRHYIANGTAGLISSSTTKPNESWEFLKWWMSVETQSNFAFDLQSTYGPTYTWLSGNIDAFRKSPFPEDDRDVILEQIKWLVDVPRTPGQYMLERSLSDIWNSAVFEGVPTGIAVDRYTILIDREIRRKMIEFGFLDLNGNSIIPYYIRDIDWVKAQIKEVASE